MDRAIIVDHLVKNFEVTETSPGVFGTIKSILSPKTKTVHALRSLSFAIQPGEVVGLVGVGGSGKTTLLKVLSGLVSPTSGFVEVLEYDPWERKLGFLKSITFIGGRKDQFWWDKSVRATLELNRATYDLSTHEYEQQLRDLVEIFDVEKMLDIPVANLNISQRVRAEFVVSLIHKPEIIFLDDPALGLDLVSRQKISDSIYKYNKKFGSTIIFSTSSIDGLAEVVRRVMVLNEGKIVFDGALEDVISKFATEKIINVIFENDKGLDTLDQIGKVRKINFPKVTLSTPRSTVYVAASELLQNYPVESLSIEEMSVSDVVKNMITEK